MRKQSRLAVTAASLLALSAIGGVTGFEASAQPPSHDADAVEADVEDADTAADSDAEASDVAPVETPAAAGGGAGGGSGDGAAAPAAQPALPNGTEPAAVSPETAPLGSSGGGGTGGNGRPTQDPVKDG
jgi:hypothetical protein